jgi:hypothetical protein
VRFPRIRRFPGWVACCLCMLIPVLVGCGDYCLFCEGQGSGGGSGGGTDEGTGKPGDVILADQFANSIFIYEHEDEEQRSLLSGYSDVSGLALYSSGAQDTCDNPFTGLAAYQNGGNNFNRIDTFSQEALEPDRLSLAVIPKGMTFPYGLDQTDPDETTIDLLFFTVNTQNRLYIYDLTGVNVPDERINPQSITNSDMASIFGRSDFFESPTAIVLIADSQDEDEAVIFVLNDNLNVATGVNDSSVRRLRVDLTDWSPTSAQEIGTMKEQSWRLFDIAYDDQTDRLFVSVKTELQQLTGGRVLVIPKAAERTTPVTLESNFTTAFIARDYEITGLSVAPTDEQQKEADLLSLRANEIGQVEQFDILKGDREDVLDFSDSYNFPQALAYDCTNERLLITDVPFSATIARQLFEFFP